MDNKIIYKFRGRIERLSKGGCRWVNGYSPDSDNGAVTYPWATKKECQQEATAQGKKAVFVEGEFNAN